MIQPSSGIEELRPEREWDPRTGWSTVRVFRGLGVQIEGLMMQAVASRLRVQDSPEVESPYIVLRIFIPNASDGSNPDEQIIDRWELIGNDLDKSILECERARAIPKADLAHVKAKAQETLRINDETGYNILEGIFQGDSKELFIRLVRGWPESFFEDQWVLRNTKIVEPPPAGTAKPAYVNLNRIFPTKALLIQKEKIPVGKFPFDIPEGQWLKRKPHAEEQSDGKWIITQEYWHGDLIDDFIYKTAV